ncbi:hypothetical protein ACMFMF_011917 [Clarireedia jacksonii]
MPTQSLASLSLSLFCPFIIATTHLIHQRKNNLGVALKSLSKLTPESSKLRSGCSGGITRVADHGAGKWLCGGIIIAHVVVGVEDGVGGFVDGDVVDGVGVVGEVLGEG